MGPPADRDRLLIAQLSGTAQHHAGYRTPTEEETAVAVAALRAITTRAELLAEEAGILLGAHDRHREDYPRYRHAAEFLIAAGADRALVEEFVEVGRARAKQRATLDGGRPWSADPQTQKAGQ